MVPFFVGDMNAASDWVRLIEVLAWPVTILIILGILYRQLSSLLLVLVDRIKAGAGLETPWLSVSAIPSDLEPPAQDEPITANHMALIHSSWRYPKKDSEFGRPMYALHAVIQAPDEVLDRIEYARYELHPSYPNPVQTVTDRISRFKLKELAWGESMLRAKVKIKGQEEPIKLSRYINLTQTGPRI